MKPALFLTLGVIATLAMSGCVAHHWVAKDVSGKVVDADSGRAIGGVQIYRLLDARLSPVAKTDEEGRFHVDGLRKMRIQLPIGDPVHGARLVFKKEGYADSSVSCGTITGEVFASTAPTKGHEIVEMKKEPNQPIQRNASTGGRFEFRVASSAWLIRDRWAKKKMSIPVSKTTANHYIWGKVCDGWRLANSPDLSVIEERVPAGASEMRHYHEKARQFFYILSGIATLEIDGSEFQISPNSGIEVAPGLRHKFMNRSSGDVCFLVISAPSTQGDRIDVENHGAQPAATDNAV